MFYRTGYAQAALTSRGPMARVSALAAFCVCHVLRARGEDQVGYRYEKYAEDGDRINVQTHSMLFEVRPKPWLNLQAEIVYDAISGASPTGSPPPSTINFVPDANGNPPPGASSTSVPVSEMHDKRYAGSLSATFSHENQRFIPQFAYSEESDYRSRGAALNYSRDFNEKNTTLNLGWAHTWDEILPNGFLHNQRQNKEADDLIAGVNQLLGPKTVLTANFTYGHARGYLNDQYKGVLFDNEPQGDPQSPALEPENRPRQRDRYLIYVSVTQALTPLNASIEASYRLFHDTYDINAHTLQVAWFQKIGKHVVISPMFRYYRQSAAFFYATRFPDFNTRPANYSADYRLSEMETFTLGLNVTWKIKDWLALEAGYKRYVMEGLDGVTSQTAYPSANVATIGGRIWF